MFSLFKNKLTVDQAAEKFYTIMGQDDKKRWLSQLSRVPGLDTVRAADELLFLDLFAIYFSLKFTRSAGWSEKGILVFENIFNRFIGFLGDFWESKNAGTKEDAFKTIDGRFADYGANLEASPEDPESIHIAVGLVFARLCLVEDNDTAIKIAGDAFNYRMQMLYNIFDSYKLK